MEFWQINLYILILVVSSLVAVILFGYAWRLRHIPGVIPFIIICTAAFIWSTANIFEILASALQTKLFWANLQYTSYVTIPVAYVALAMQYSGQYKPLARHRILILLIIPVITLLLVWTNDSHGLMRSDIHLESIGSTTHIVKTYGPWFWVHTAYSYILISSTILIMIHTLRHAHSLYKKQTFALLGGILITTSWNVMYVIWGLPYKYMDLSPAALSASGIITSLALFRYGLFDIIPIARDAVMESMEDGVLVVDTRNRIVDINPSAEAIFKLTMDQCIGKYLVDICQNWPDMAGYCDNITQPRAQVSFGNGESMRYYDLNVLPVHSGNKTIEGRLLVFHDITDSKEIEEALRRSEERYKVIFENTGTAMMIIEDDSTISMINSIFNRTFGYTIGDLMNKTWTSFIQKSEKEADLYDDDDQSVNTANKDEYILLDKQGNKRYVIYNITQIPETNKSIASIIDITKRKHSENLIQFMAYNDFLTGIPNNAFFQTRLSQEVSRATRQNGSLVVMFMDLDGFKTINDTYGHDIGNRLLCELANRLNDTTRSCDMVARFGGDEFTILLTDTKSIDDSISFAKRLMRLFSEPITMDNHDYNVTASIGISMFPRHGLTPEILIKRADYAMYVAKRLGKNRFFVYNNECDDRYDFREPDIFYKKHS